MVVSKDLAEARRLLIEALQKLGVKAYSAADRHGVFCSNDYGSFELSFLPGNRRTLVSHAVTIYPKYRGKGYGTLTCRIREDAAREAGVTLLLATVRDDNAAEIRVLTKCNWGRLTQNLETHCSLWGKTL